MENSFSNDILKKILCLVIISILISSAIFKIDDIRAYAQEPTELTLNAGTYRFNADLTITIDGPDGHYSFPFVSYNSNGVQLDFNDFYVDMGVIEYNGSQVWGDAVGWLNPLSQSIIITSDSIVDYVFGTWFIASTDYTQVNSAVSIPYTNVVIPTDLQIMENINMDINGFGSTTSNDNVGITALNGEILGRIRTNDGTTIPFNGIAVTSFDSWRTTSTYVYPLTDDVIATSPFTISNGLMLYVWDDIQYYQVAWFNPVDELWYVHGDYAIIVPYGQRSTTSIGTLSDGIAISLAIAPNLTADDLGYVELGGFEDTPPYDNIITVADENAYSTFAMFCNSNFISDSEKLSWGIAQHQSGQNLGQSQQLGDNILGQFLQAPIDILDSIVIYTTPNGTAVTLMGVFGALLTLSLVIIFLKLFAGG